MGGICAPTGKFDVNEAGRAVGDAGLARVVDRIKPALHVFGHIHPGRCEHDTDNAT